MPAKRFAGFILLLILAFTPGCIIHDPGYYPNHRVYYSEPYYYGPYLYAPFWLGGHYFFDDFDRGHHFKHRGFDRRGGGRGHR